MIKRLLQNEHYKKYFYNTGWLIGEKIVRIIATIFVGVLVARYLGPADYGILNYGLSFIALFTPIATLGLSDILVRELVHNQKQEHVVLGTALGLRLIGSIVVVLAVFGVVSLTEQDHYIRLLITIISLGLLFQPLDVLDRYFQSKVKAQTTVKAYLVSLIVASVAKVVCVFLKLPLLYFAYIQIGELLLLSISWGYLYLSTNNTFRTWKFDLSLAKTYLRESWVLVISSLSVILYMRIDQVMIKEMLNPVLLGNFTAAIKLSESFYFVPIVITSSLYPAILFGKQSSELMYRQRLQKLFDLLTWLAFPIAVGTSLFANFIALFLYGKDYPLAGQVLSIHIWCGIFAFWGTASTKWFIIEKIPRYITISTFTGCLLNISLNFWLIPHFGIRGAAIASLTAQVTTVFLSLLIFRKTRSLFRIMLGSFNAPRIIRGLLNKYGSSATQ